MADSSAARIIARLHGSPHLRADWFIRIMVQDGKPEPRAKLDELADSLAQIAIAGGAADTDTPRGDEAAGAVTALHLAGLVGASRGTPYDGALDRLIRIHREAQNRALRVVALADLLAVPGRPAAIAYLREVATSNDVTASNALFYLIADAQGRGGPGKPPTAAQQQETASVLHDLFEKHLVRDSKASRALDAWADTQGWVRP
jgi:hypothetical protein